FFRRGGPGSPGYHSSQADRLVREIEADQGIAPLRPFRHLASLLTFARRDKDGPDVVRSVPWVKSKNTAQLPSNHRASCTNPSYWSSCAEHLSVVVITPRIRSEPARQ